jgi:predicted PurR-regulated permease PerM
MSHKAIQISFFGLVSVFLLVLLFFIFRPFLGVIFLSGVLSVTFYPLFAYFNAKWGGRAGLASIATVLAIVILIVIPVILLSTSLLREALDLYNHLAFGDDSTQLVSFVNNSIRDLESVMPFGNMFGEVNVEQHIRQILGWIIGHTDSLFAVVFGSLFKFILMLLSIFYLLIYGEKIKQTLVSWSPLPDKYDEEFISTLKNSVDAVLRGRILVSIGQGIMLGVGFAIFGVGNPALWGFVGAIISLVPIVGTSLVSIPAVAYLLLTGHIGASVGLLIWSAVCVGFVDNVLSFIFFKGRIQVHPLVVLFSILGGVELFGVIGFLVGPVIVSAFVALTKIYPFIVPPRQDSGER